MKKPRYTDQQIAQALRQAEQGLPVAEFCRKLGVSETTFYHWKKRYAGMGVAQPSGRPRIAQAGAVAICERLELRAL
jgi:transposase-like protein